MRLAGTFVLRLQPASLFVFHRDSGESASRTSHHTVARSVCLGRVGSVMFINTVKMPRGISRRGVSEGERGGMGWLVWKLTSVL